MARKWQHIPYQRIADLYYAGLSTVEIAKATDRYQEQAVDRTKSLRVVLSIMINDGYIDKDGKLVWLTKKPVITGKRTKK
jgi:hypothetical protein